MNVPILASVAQPHPSRRIVLDPVARVEAHGKVTIHLGAANEVQQVRLHIAEVRGFEAFLEGRPYAEVPASVQRLCGICPVSHNLAAAKAMDRIAGYDRLPPSAEKLRRLMHCGQIVQSHAVHFYHLAAPDLLFGHETEADRRAQMAVAQEFPQIATEGVLVRRFGQEVVRATAGKRGAGGGAIPGGMRNPLPQAERDMLRADVDQVIDWAVGALHLLARLHETNPAFYGHFGEADGNMIGLVTASGAADFYHGTLRARDALGATVFDGMEPGCFRDTLAEQAAAWPTTPHPHIAALGPERGWYRVGPLARLQVCDLLTSEKAETERQRLLAIGGGKPLHGALFYHWARLVELLHAAELIRELFDDPEICGTDLIGDRKERRFAATGAIEAPRGTLLHHYIVDEEDRVAQCSIIVSTTHNTRAMNETIRVVAERYLDGPEVSEALLGHIEVAIRAYDPCLSCATHGLGQMPLEVELCDAEGARLSGLWRGADGRVV